VAICIGLVGDSAYKNPASDPEICFIDESNESCTRSLISIFFAIFNSDELETV
jgi:hypothetical protein